MEHTFPYHEKVTCLLISFTNIFIPNQYQLHFHQKPLGHLNEVVNDHIIKGRNFKASTIIFPPF